VSCFYRRIERQADGSVTLAFSEGPRVDPAALYRQK
jgi:hypothetical protein